MTTYAEYQQQIMELQAKANAVRKAEIAKARAEILTLMSVYGLTVEDLGAKPPKKERKPVPVKYRDPDSGRTWSGRGRMPEWISGKDRKAFEV